MKEMEKVRETREKLLVEKQEHEQHFAQLSPWNFPVVQAKEQFENKNQMQMQSKLQEEFSLDSVCSGGTNTSNVHPRNKIHHQQYDQ